MREGPLRFELMFAAPGEITAHTDLRPHDARLSTDDPAPWVEGGDWDRASTPIASDRKHVMLMRHLRGGVPWEETGIYRFVSRNLAQRQRLARGTDRNASFDGCRSEAEVHERYRRIDALVATVRAEARLRTAWEVAPGPLAQRGGVWVQMARDGAFLFGNVGYHRLAVAQAAGLRRMPVALTVAHADAVANGWLERRRAERAAVLKELGLDLPPEGIAVHRDALIAHMEARTRR